jgi:two-component system LytT family response regulator
MAINATIKTVIIDDENNNIINLHALLQKHCPQINVIAVAHNAKEGEQVILEHKPDLIFLDIQMPDKTGFELLQALPKLHFEIIFVTAYDKYGIQAVKFAALDYLLKPIDVKELKQAINKVENKHADNKNKQLENLLELLQHQQQKEDHRIALPTAKEIRFIKTSSIIRCEASNNYTTFFFSDGEKLLVSKPIYEYEELLKEYSFIRCHQSHLVNKKFIRSLVKEEGGYLLLDDNTHIPVSKQKKETLKILLTK